MDNYRVTFADGRIGRSRGNDPIEVEVGDGDEQQQADAIAEAIFRHARTHLASSWFEVAVDMSEGRGSIEAGRFGSFTVEAIA